VPAWQGIPHGQDRSKHQVRQHRFPQRAPALHAEGAQASQALIALLAKFAEHRNATPAQIALAWLLAQKPWIVPIPGTTKLARLKENIDVAAIELTADDPREVESSSAEIHGARADRLSSPRDRSAA
jgi:aryl-alcohol dehydrogenase-like predicted oxidoreductase